MNFISVRGKGDPNDEDGEYKQAMNILYSVACTIKMSKMGDHRIEGYFNYVVPPLEGLCAQIMHIGPYDDEPATIAVLDDFIGKSGYEVDIDLRRHFHHEIYLSYPRKTAKDKLKTAIRYPIKII